MVKIDPQIARGIAKISDDRRRRNIEQAGKLKLELDRRKRAEVILGQPIDDVTYERLRGVTRYRKIMEAALDASHLFDIHKPSTIKALHLLCRPTVQEHNFARSFRETRDKRPEV